MVVVDGTSTLPELIVRLSKTVISGHPFTLKLRSNTSFLMNLGLNNDNNDGNDCLWRRG
ncbi:hypothetical protein SOVF_072470 [Spinacia oleracea]|nr:hypothetical protein SOVF_072470 [Spinacia oleracea]